MTLPSDRRRYHRVRADVLVRPVSVLARVVPRRVSDISVGGLRIYSDEPLGTGTRFEAELVFPDAESAPFLAEVVWVEELADDAPARYDIGLRFVDAQPGDLARVRELLAPP